MKKGSFVGSLVLPGVLLLFGCTSAGVIALDAPQLWSIGGNNPIHDRRETIESDE